MLFSGLYLCWYVLPTVCDACDHRAGANCYDWWFLLDLAAIIFPLSSSLLTWKGFSLYSYMYFLDSSYKIHYCTIYIMMMIHDIIQLSMPGYFLSTQTTHIPRTLLWLHNPLSTLLIPMCILCAWDGISLVTDLANIETVTNVAIFLYLYISPWSPPSWINNAAPMFLWAFFSHYTCTDI